MRSFPSFICRVLLLAAVTVTFTAVARADRPGPNEALPAAQVAIDEDSGLLRQPTPAERERLAAAMADYLQRVGATGPDTPIVARADGSRSKVLDARYRQWLTATTAGDRSLTGQCLSSAQLTAAALSQHGREVR